jgi:hypothetical protein
MGNSYFLENTNPMSETGNKLSALVHMSTLVSETGVETGVKTPGFWQIPGEQGVSGGCSRIILITRNLWEWNQQEKMVNIGEFRRWKVLSGEFWTDLSLETEFQRK